VVQLSGREQIVKLLYFDCFSGAAGDMILGAFLDAGLPLAALKRALGSLGVDGWDVSAERVVKAGITATKFRVHEHAGRAHDHGHDHHSAHHQHRHHTVAEIKQAIDRSALSETGKARAKRLFDRLAEAEAAVHDMPVETVHLHEVGELDSIVDIVGAVFAFEWFNADRVVVSPINVGSGMIKTVHGLYPVPAPATVRLLAKAPIYGRDVKTELLTPTGALILSDYAADYGPMPAMRVERSGYGAGDRDLEGTPNVLRLVIGEGDRAASAMRVAVIECEIDDMNPQIFGVLMDRLYAAGALDVFYAPVQMKKNRPGTLVTIVAKPDQRELLIDVMFRESTTIGVRSTEMARECLDRETVAIATPMGNVRFKVATRHGEVFNAQPEFEDVARLAEDQGRPIKEVQAMAMKAWLDRGA
jgi:pyridinium-3,5-bisthiocarboxylic acid mononucleotide nickel chelatase